MTEVVWRLATWGPVSADLAGLGICETQSGRGGMGDIILLIMARKVSMAD